MSPWFVCSPKCCTVRDWWVTRSKNPSLTFPVWPGSAGECSGWIQKGVADRQVPGEVCHGNHGCLCLITAAGWWGYLAAKYQRGTSPFVLICFCKNVVLSSYKWLLNSQLPSPVQFLFRHYLQVQSQGHHTIDHLEERGMERGSARRSSLKGPERAIVSQTNIGTVSKATLWKFLRWDGVHMGFSKCIDAILN